jgi:hypothetical protein
LVRPDPELACDPVANEAFIPSADSCWKIIQEAPMAESRVPDADLIDQFQSRREEQGAAVGLAQSELELCETAVPPDSARMIFARAA